jgi:hypothetical protein
MADGAPATPKDNIVPGLTFELTCIADGAPADSFLSDENIGYKIHTQATKPITLGSSGMNKGLNSPFGIQTALQLKRPQLGGREVQSQTSPKKARNCIVSKEFSKYGAFGKLEELFDIVQQGTYILEVRIRVWVRRSDGSHGVLVSRPVTAKIVKK